MISHTVMWKFKDENKEENMNTIAERLMALYKSGKIDGLRKMEIGKDVSHTDMSYDMVLLTEFDSMEALAAYKIHPDHVAISQFVKTVRTARAVVDFEF
ncbi:MAG: Dabb family protein [Clostridia bacterium]|nr:Dabb family protein [Clostridia bacterium]